MATQIHTRFRPCFNILEFSVDYSDNSFIGDIFVKAIKNLQPAQWTERSNVEQCCKHVAHQAGTIPHKKIGDFNFTLLGLDGIEAVSIQSS